MQWRSAVKRSVFALLLVSCMSLGPAAAASYATTQINAVVCNGTVTPEITLASPLNDSVVNQLSIPLNGSVKSVSQITVSLDGNYNSSVAIAANETSFATTVEMSEGTHTITLAAHGICGGPTADVTIVISVSLGSQPTQTPPTTTLPEPPVYPSTSTIRVRDDDITHANGMILEQDDGYGFHPVFRDKATRTLPNPVLKQAVEAWWAVVFVSGASWALFGHAALQLTRFGTAWMSKKWYMISGIAIMIIAALSAV